MNMKQHTAYWANWWVSLAMASAATPAPAWGQTPIRLHPGNPQYFLYGSKPAVLLTSGEHYSAVLNRRFDDTAYLDELQRNGFNLTRTFSGVYREDGNNPHGVSPLSPGRGPENYIAPWAWSDVEGGYDGRKFDLDHWNPAYFTRLRDFVAQAGKRGVVVELVLFCLMYSDEHHWRVSPLHPDNNLQGEPWRGLPNRRFLTLDNAALVERQKAVARKIVTELRDLPNVYFEVANEPAPAPADSDLARDNFAWHQAMIDEIVAAEAPLPAAGRHLIAYNDHYNAGQGIAAIPRPAAVSILNVHYLPRLAEALEQYGKGRALAVDETRWIAHPKFPEYGNTMKPDSGRVEAWEFLLGGGAVYDGLNYAYQVDNPTGNTPESNEFKGYLRKLKEFITGFDFIAMRPDRDVVAGGLPQGSIWRAISEAGRQYAVYIHHSRYAEGRLRYEVSEQPRTLDLAVDLPAGGYQVEWLRPADLTVLKTQAIPAHGGGRIALQTSPQYRADIALRIVSSE
jgi:hypothetical protein